MSKIIMGVHLQNRMKDATNFQSILSKYGCSITTRLGLHMSASDTCGSSGLIILEFVDNADKEAQKFEEEVSALENIRIQKMVF